MLKKITCKLGLLLEKAASTLPASLLEGLAGFCVRARIRGVPAEVALRYLFRLDTDIYAVEGVKAIEYGGGVHTKHRHMRYHDFFVERIGKGERVLDVGCGDGALTCDVAERSGAEVLGMDLSEDNIARARERHPHQRVEYRLGDATEDLPEGDFDAVVLSNILEHLPDRPRFLKRLSESSRASRILLRVPLFEREWRVPLKKELGVEWRLDPTHETEYTKESFLTEMAEAGFRITDHEIRWGEIWAVVVPVSTPGRD
jgi:2-polyprenyl-3-methyl-5-hydroxy-6-metoxy-1,4-benzoquinol methylase